jgi:hypothetical protein
VVVEGEPRDGDAEIASGELRARRATSKAGSSGARSGGGTSLHGRRRVMSAR